MNSNKEKPRIKREVNFRLVAQIVMVLTLIGIIVTTIMIFTPQLGGSGYGELSVLTYNETDELYETDNFPTSVIYNQTEGLSENITLFFMVKNQYRIAKFFQVRLKIGLYSLIIDENTFGSNISTYFHEEHWKSKVLNREEQWGPNTQTETTFNFNSTILTHLGYEANGYKIIFELWEFDSSENVFVFSGIFVYLTSFQLILVS
ncbi:MAG: hypothetical protein GPJ52_06950 [Candidatus Heimdallarchaeota archaeon]|nr:hypothetical protein [Candidatus Heimdallarchaeota archaeon]